MAGGVLALKEWGLWHRQGARAYRGERRGVVCG